jgi:hypothetical protein
MLITLPSGYRVQIIPTTEGPYVVEVHRPTHPAPAFVHYTTHQAALDAVIRMA